MSDTLFRPLQIVPGLGGQPLPLTSSPDLNIPGAAPVPVASPLSPLTSLPPAAQNNPPTVNLNPTQPTPIGGVATSVFDPPAFPAAPVTGNTPVTPVTAATSTAPAGAVTQGTPSAQATGGLRASNFIEDITDQQIINNTLPISFKYGSTGIAQESGVTIADGQFHRDQSVTGAILSQVQSAVTGNLLQLTLEIRGDPYWLGQTNLDRALVLRSGAPTYSKDNAPDWASSKELIFVTFRYPLTVGDDFVPVLRQSQSFNGLYMVYHIKHVFADGAFKQIIQAVRQPLIQNDLASGTAGANGNAAPGVSGASTGGSGQAQTADDANGDNVNIPGGNGPQTPTTAAQQANAQQFRDALTSQAAAQGVNLTSDQVDGIVANAYRESSMNPQVSNGQGLLQWSDPSRNAAANAFMQSNYGTTLATSTIDQQAAWTINELNTTEQPALTAIQANTTSGAASDAVVTSYERSANQPLDQTKSRGFLSNLYGTNS